MIGTHPNVGFKFGRWLDTVMMQRGLGDGGNKLPVDAAEVQAG
jgi:phosphinothricin acetyltransferase